MPSSVEGRLGGLLEAVYVSAVQVALCDSYDRVLRVGSGVAVAVDETKYVGEVWRDVGDLEPLCFLAAAVRKRTITPLLQVQIQQESSKGVKTNRVSTPKCEGFAPKTIVSAGCSKASKAFEHSLTKFCPFFQ